MSDTPQSDLTPSERAEDLAGILRALRQAVREALRRHKLDGDPGAVWRDGRVVWIQPEDIPVSVDTEETYSTESGLDRSPEER